MTAPPGIDDETRHERTGVLAVVTRDLGLKVLALALAVALWLVIEVWRPADRRPAERRDTPAARGR